MANLSQHAGGGNRYLPPMTLHDANTQFGEMASGSVWTHSGTALTFCFRFRKETFADDALHMVFRQQQDATYAGSVQFYGTGYTATPAYAGKLAWTINTSGAYWTLVVDSDVVDVMDGNEHFLVAGYDAATGDTFLYVDGLNADDMDHPNRSVPSGETLTTGTMRFCANYAGFRSTWSCGYLGWAPVYVSDPSLFYDAVSGLQPPDKSGWSQFDGTTPYFFSEYGGRLNEGSGSDLAWKCDTGYQPGIDSTSDVVTGLGLDTTATAVDADIAAGKTAWVNGLQVTGTLVPGASLTSKVLVKYDFSGPNATAIDVADYEVWRDPSVTVAVGTDGTRDIFDGGLHTAATYLLFGLDMPTLAADTARVYTVTGRVAGLGATDGHLDMCIDQDGLNNVGTAYYLRMILSSGMHRTNFFRRDAWADSYPFGAGISAHFNANDLFFTNTVIQTDTALQGSALLHSISGQRGVGFGGGGTDGTKRNSQYASIAFWPGNSEIRVDSISVIDIPNPV